MVDISHSGFYGHATHNVSLLIIVKIPSKVICVIRNCFKLPLILFEITFITVAFKGCHVYTTQILQMIQTSSRDLNRSLTFKFPSSTARQYKPVNSNPSSAKCGASGLVWRRYNKEQTAASLPPLGEKLFSSYHFWLSAGTRQRPREELPTYFPPNSKPSIGFLLFSV